MLDAFIDKFDLAYIFAAIPLTAIELDPLLSQMHGPTREGIVRLIGEYAGHLPPDTDIMDKIMAIQ